MTYNPKEKNDDLGRNIAKLFFGIAKMGVSHIIESELTEQERKAKEENRSTDLMWINLAKNVKHDVDSTLDDLISSI